MTNLELLVSTDIYLEDQRAILTTNLSSDEEILSDIHRRKRAERAKSDLYTEESDGFFWFVKNMEKGNVTKRLEAIAASGSTTTTVTMPKGTKVSAIIYEDMSATEKKEKTIYMHHYILRQQEYIRLLKNSIVIPMHGIHRIIVPTNIELEIRKLIERMEVIR